MTDRKEVFDAFREFMGGRLTQTETDALDEFLDRFDPGELPAPAEMTISPEGVALIQDYEGYEPTTYRDPGSGDKPYTGGWGTTRDEQGKPLPLGVTWPRSRWEALLKRDLDKYGKEVLAALGGAPTTQAQFDALVSFHYNTGAIGRATLTKKHKAGDYAGAARQFARWNRSGGKVLAGLTRRRAAEAALYKS